MSRPLQERLLQAHAAGDRRALVALYLEAAEASQGQASDFYLTHAYVFALEAGLPDAPELQARLEARGRD